MKTLPLALTILGITLTSLAHAAVKNVVVVHGAFADGSGWKSVADILEHDGYTVYVVQEPETTFEAERRRHASCARIDRGHAYSSAIVTLE